MLAGAFILSFFVIFFLIAGFHTSNLLTLSRFLYSFVELQCSVIEEERPCCALYLYASRRAVWLLLNSKTDNFKGRNSTNQYKAIEIKTSFCSIKTMAGQTSRIYKTNHRLPIKIKLKPYLSLNQHVPLSRQKSLTLVITSLGLPFPSP